MSVIRTLQYIASPIAFAIIASSASPSLAREKPDAKFVLAKVREEAAFARIKNLLAADAKGSRLRIDGFSLSSGDRKLKVSGVLLVDGADDEQMARAAKQTREVAVEIIRKASGAESFDEFDFDAGDDAGSIKEIRGDRLPHVLLQKAANLAGEKNSASDEIVLTSAHFNAEGRLVLTGMRSSNAEAQKWLDEAISTALADSPAALGPNGKKLDGSGKPWVSTEKVTALGKSGSWPTATALQKALIQRNDPKLARFRIDRLYFVPTPNAGGDSVPSSASFAFALSGIALGTDPPDARAIVGVCDELFRSAFGAPVKSGDLEGLTNADFRIPDPAPKFQKAIASVPDLDGVRIDGRTEFDESGRLVLTGLQPGLDEKGSQELAARVQQVLKRISGGSDGNPLYGKLAKCGVSLEKLERNKIRDLHAEMRKWAGEALDDVRLTRLHFNEVGRLTLVCDAPPSSESSRSLVEAELKKRAASYKYPPIPQGLEGRTAALEPCVEAGPDPFKGSLTNYLKALSTDPEKPEWQAIAIERGYFDEANRFAIRGVVDSDEQKKRFDQHVESLQGDPQWRAYFAVPAAPSQLVVIPMADLVARVQRVTPGYPTFDGVRIVSAKYAIVKDDKSGFAEGTNLIFSAQVVGRPNLYEGRVLLAELIAKHPSFSRRLIQSTNERFPRLRIELAPAQPAAESEQVGNFGNAFGASYLARAQGATFLQRLFYLSKASRWIESGLMHEPDQSSIWFLSAYFHLLAGDRELTRRDLHRTVGIEYPLAFNGGDQRRRRYEVAKDLQGAKRDELEKLWLQCWEETKNGAKPIAMVPAK